ncbi:Uncharacterised protein [Streptococcus dysgalactiae subsp. equisimilis]|nr:Uncharacterised protein [Streptococcus dysgalactiae subsp. equisimilis]
MNDDEVRELLNQASNKAAENIKENCVFNDTATTEIYTHSLHDALPITRLPNELALKMDGAQAFYLYPSAGAKFTPQRVGRRGGP